ncbi:hypothetical protein [Nitrosomonas sp.]|uniref:hypothetical protein n=1 Tax=Nitrosomonas sp. TaxID=42353 RepID=UPI0025E19E84|nr:hypothetical protein [Nitrosomonas sp.]
MQYGWWYYFSGSIKSGASLVNVHYQWNWRNLTGTISGKHNVILVFGIRGAGTCELEIPKRNYDPLFAAGDH